MQMDMKEQQQQPIIDEELSSLFDEISSLGTSPAQSFSRGVHPAGSHIVTGFDSGLSTEIASQVGEGTTIGFSSNTINTGDGSASQFVANPDFCGETAPRLSTHSIGGTSTPSVANPNICAGSYSRAVSDSLMATYNLRAENLPRPIASSGISSNIGGEAPLRLQVQVSQSSSMSVPDPSLNL
jgi:hypothetical protein